MLFQRFDHQERDLWSARRCAAMLFLSMVVFFGLVIFAASRIHFAPTVEVSISRRAGQWICSPKHPKAVPNRAAQPLYLRYLGRSRTDLDQTREISVTAGDSNEFLLHTRKEINPTATAFLVYPRQSLFEFLWQRVAP